MPKRIQEILIVDDDRNVRNTRQALFEASGYAVRTARDGEEGLRLCAEKSPDLILLDVMMPRKDGISMCKELRQNDLLTPILFYTAMPNDVVQVVGLGCGGDDYIDKASPDEVLLARVAAALRRAHLVQGASERRQEPPICIGETRIDLYEGLVYGDDSTIRLSRAELRAMTELAHARGHLVTFDRFLEAFGGTGYTGTDESVRKVVQRLKLKLGAVGHHIVGVPSQGYYLLP